MRIVIVFIILMTSGPLWASEEERDNEIQSLRNSPPNVVLHEDVDRTAGCKKTLTKVGFTVGVFEVFTGLVLRSLKSGNIDGNFSAPVSIGLLFAGFLQMAACATILHVCYDE